MMVKRTTTDFIFGFLSISTSVFILKWEKNVNWTLLTNMVLEGIFHSKQHDLLTKIWAHF